MLPMECVCTKVDGTKYTIEYVIIQGEKGENENSTEYGICCRLYEAEDTVDVEEVKGITAEKGLITKILSVLEKNQVFPVHMREIIEDLLILEYEEKIVSAFT